MAPLRDPERDRSHILAARVRREIALDSSAPTGDRLRAIEQVESRALGKPKETLVQETEEPEALRLLREMSDADLERIISGSPAPEQPSAN